ncbi:MAG: class I tRNA ligase family protein, partial [Proteobacteria bacterium]|nr:class I tRNA ligase family protein [Pseudomonadota bacterium]
HGGGKDLIFPHHENEIAQSEGAFGKPFARFWIHNGFVNINQEKMSKSLGNFLMIKDILKSFHPETVRLFLLSSHYRSPIDFTDKAMDEASAGLDKIYALLERIEEKKELSEINNVEPGNYYEHFCKAMDDDFNTARGISVLFEAVRNINRLLDESKEGLSQDTIKDIISCKSDILKIRGILGILYESPEAYFEGKKSKALGKKSIDPAVIEDMVREREKARMAKNWAKADKIRNHLEVMNIVIEDRPEGTIWKVKTG